MTTIDQAMTTALQHHQAGRLGEAERLYRAVLQQQPTHPDALHLLGLIARRAGRLDLAEQLIRRAVEANSSSPHYLGHLGMILAEQKRLEESVEFFQKALAIDPRFAQTRNNLGVVLRDLQRFEESVAEFQSAIQIEPRFAEAHSNLSTSLMKLGRHEEAIAAGKRAVELSPALVGAHYNLGTAFSEMDRLPEAAVELSRAIELEPNYATAISNLGNVRRGMGMLDQAMAEYARAIAIDPSYAEAHWNLALTALIAGDFDQGWFEHEWRFSCQTLHRPQMFTQPQWHGEPLEGRTILLHVEQGLGDSIQFVRYAPMVAAAGGVVLIQTPPRLVKLFQTLPGDLQIISTDQPLPEFQLHCPLMSLPLAFSTRLETIPASIPYLSATAEQAEEWKGRLQSCQELFKVGLVWAGSQLHQNDRKRSIALSRLLPLSQLQGVQFVSLQKGPGAGQIALQADQWKLLNFENELGDFADTAGLISQLDLVIAVDTSVAHLAGAMGKPVWLMVATDPDWRWLLNRDDSPWYPTMRIFRQKTAGDWAAVIDRVHQELLRHPSAPGSAGV